MSEENPKNLNESLARFAPVADEAERRIAESDQHITDNFRGDDKALIDSAVSLLALDAKGALSGGGLGGHARTIIESFIVRHEKMAKAMYRQELSGYFSAWNPPGEAPGIKLGNHKKFLLCCENNQGETDVYSAFYCNYPMNLVSLDDHEFYDQNGDPFDAVGWFNKKMHDSYDTYFEQITFSDQYNLLGWAEYSTTAFGIKCLPAQAEAIPDWLMEMSNQMRTQDNRGTSHPFFQVRCKEYLPTDPECSADRWEIVGDDGVVCTQGDEGGFIDYLLANHADWCKQWNEQNYDEESDRDALESWFDPTGGELPDPLRLIWTQEVEKIVSTHLTEAGAIQFINRKQHDYPKLYTYAESAYWSPQLRQLQDWIISLSAPKPDSTGGEPC